MDPNEFLGLISMATTRDEDLVRLGTIGVMGAPPTRATVVFDGEDIATSKEYFIATTDSLANGDRVILIRVGHSWLIMGKVAAVSGQVDLLNNQDMIRFLGAGGPMGILWRGDAPEGEWEAQLVYRTNPDTLGIENAASAPLMEWDLPAMRVLLYGDLNLQNNALITSDGGSNNIDHIWHDDGSNQWHFVSDSPYKDPGNSQLRAFSFYGALGGTESNPTFGFAGGSAGLYNNSGFLTAAMSGERTLHFSTTQIVGIVYAGSGEKNLGNASNRWRAVYATDGTINTSDMKEKEESSESDLGIDFIRSLTPRKWRWKWGVRPHYGLFAQEVKKALDDLGISDFAGFIDPSVDWEYNEEDPQLSGEEPGPLGLRYHEFIGPMIKAIQELSEEVETLKSKVATLERNSS